MDLSGDLPRDYLASHGPRGDFARFRPVRPLSLGRGDRVVVHTHRGLELATVLRPASPRAATYLPNTSLGQLLRLATAEDEAAARDQRARAEQLFTRAAERVQELGLPLSILDAEILLDGSVAVLHHLRFGPCDFPPLVSALAREFDAHILLTDLADGDEPAEGAPGTAGGDGHADGDGDDHGCGSCGSGGCGTGGCGTGGCADGGGGCGPSPAGDSPEATREYFAELRRQMEQRRPLV